MSQSTCSHQAYTYTYRTTCQCQLWESIDQPFVFDWQVWPQTVPPHQFFRTSVQNLVWVSTLILTFHRKVHIACIQMFLSLEDVECMKIVLWLCVPTCICCCVPQVRITLQVHHIPTAWLKSGVCAFSIPPHSFCNLPQPGAHNVWQQDSAWATAWNNFSHCWTQTVNTGMFKFKGGDHRLTWSVCAYLTQYKMSLTHHPTH